MTTENNDNGRKISKEELANLLMQMQKNMSAGGGMPGMNPSAPTKMTFQMRMKIIFSNIIKFCQDSVHYVDRFVNFVTKASDKDRDELMQWARQPILFGIFIIVFAIGFGGLWSFLAPLDSASNAIGTVITVTKKKTIQHQEGGMIKNIFVKQGDIVKAEDPIAEIDDTKIRGSFEEYLEQYRVSLANVNRLEAERDNADKIVFNDFLLKESHLPKVMKIIDTQETLFKNRRDFINVSVDGMNNKINQTKLQIDGLLSQKDSTEKQLRISNERLSASQKLHSQGFLDKAHLQEMESRNAELQSNLSRIKSDIARLEQEISKNKLDIINIKNEFLTKVVTELRESQTQAAVHYERYTSLADSLRRTILRSPVDGIVNNINVHTIGQVILPQTEVAEITPTNDSLIIEARIPPKNIDSVVIGLNAKVRFSAYKSRTTPVFSGKVISLSPDVVKDELTAQASGGREVYSYIARIELDMKEFNKIAKVKNLVLHPGMTAEIQIVTGTRTLMKYLLDPILDNMFRAFVEK